MKIIYALFFVLIIISNSCAAAEGHMTLLTVGEKGNETIGGTADVYLEVKQGSGRVFIDSFPLTKLDTQISTRFAKEVACDFLEKDCSNKDFFYTIRAKSSVVGGPSAGAALTVLTIAVLEEQELNQNVVMTGTINSGGIVGPVAGIEEKAKAAKAEGFSKVLVPKRSIISNLENITSLENITLDYSDSLKIEGIEIIPVSTLEDALVHFTGKKYPDYSYNISVPEQYENVMKKVALNICERSKEIDQILPRSAIINHSEIYNISLNYTERANKAFEKGDYYTAASFCFNSNKFLRQIEYSQYSDSDLKLIKLSAKQDIIEFYKEVNKKELKTLSDLEISMVVKERLFEAEDLLKLNTSEEPGDLAYIVERVHSARAWSGFFEYSGKEVILDEAHLRDACLGKIAEAEERINYLELLFGESEDYREELQDVKNIYSEGDYTFCLFKASRVKADANAVITSLSITDEKVGDLINDQLKIARIQINKQGNDFPIIGYSYYNYALSLKDVRPDLSIIFSEYASEFSNLDMYFPKKERNVLIVDEFVFGSFMVGFSAGVVFIVVVILCFFSIGTKIKRKHRNK